MPAEVARVQPQSVVSGGPKASPRLYTLHFNAVRAARLLRGLEVVQEDGALLRLLTPVLDNDARAVDNLAGVALAVEDACEWCVSKSCTAWTTPATPRDNTYRDRPTRRAACRPEP